MKRVLIATYYRYPDGDAGAVRQHSFAKIYKELGCEVVVAGMGEHTDFSMRNYDGIPYVSFRHKKENTISKVKNMIFFLHNLKRFLKQEKKFDVIHAVNVSSKTFVFLKKYAKNRGIKLVHDSVEWYSPEQFPKGEKDRAYQAKDKLNRVLIDKQVSVIAISTFLEKHFLSGGIKTVRIPVIMDIASLSCKKNTSQGKTVFLYAGSPGKKDYLAEILRGFSLLDERLLDKSEIRILGIKKEQLSTLCGVENGVLDRVDRVLKCYGRVPREEVLKQLEQADFTVLLRSETQRYAKAGFPTKVVESLASATPVVTNLTSDLGMYLKDGENSKIVSECSPKALAKTLEETLSLTREEKERMYQNARKTAEDFFDYKKYIDEIKTIIS